MLKIRRYYNQNKKTIWKVTGFIVFFILLIQLLNYFAKSKNINNISNNINNNPSFINNSNYTDLSVSSDKSVLSNEKMTTSSSSELETINQFFNYCNNGEVDKAYSLLSDECKQEMYPELKYFKNNYYKTVFNGKKKNISIENWTGSTYKTDINDDKKERSKIRNVISYTLPYLKSTYIQKLVQTCMTDIIRWDKSFFLEHFAERAFVMSAAYGSLNYQAVCLTWRSVYITNVFYHLITSFPDTEYPAVQDHSL